MQEIFRLNLSGPGRRSDRTLIEQRFGFEPGELDATVEGTGFHERARNIASRNGIPAMGLESAVGVGEVYMALVMALQKWAGHQVSFTQSIDTDDPNLVHVAYEYEQIELVKSAMRIAATVVCIAAPELSWPTAFDAPHEDIRAALKDLKQLGRETVFPADSEALRAAAIRRDIPCVKLERFPFEAQDSEQRIRRNSLLKFGHSTQQLVVDGMLCFDRSEEALSSYHDRKNLQQLSGKYHFIVPFNENKYRNIRSYKEAKEAAVALGWPAVLKPRRRSHGQGIHTRLRDIQSLARAWKASGKEGEEHIIESHIPGQAFHVLVANLEVLAVLDSRGADVMANAAPSILKLAVDIARGEQVGLLDLTVVSPDISQPLDVDKGAVVDVDPAPRLDRLLGPRSPLLDRAVEAFLEWLYPKAVVPRIPILAVTGTNGKTTTTRMLASIFTDTGKIVGMTCTGEASIRTAHEAIALDWQPDYAQALLADPRVEVLVQEAFFGEIVRLGFAWHRCDIGVITNVTSDHIGRFGVDNLQAMADVKRSVAERADKVVLNGDNEYCLAMLPHLEGKTFCLTSLSNDVERLREAAGSSVPVMCLRDLNGEPSLVLDHDGEEVSILAVKDLPASLNGAAMHNVDNALSAAAAAWLWGIDTEYIGEALAGFEMSYEDTPGRMNIHDNGRFRVVMDYAHNEDGFRQISRFADQLMCSGRKILLYAVSKDLSDELVQEAAAVPAGHFDRYICKDYTTQEGRENGEVPSLMQESLERAGVDSAVIEQIPDENEALAHALDSCERGDLLFVLTGRMMFDSAWSKILAS